MSGKKLLLIDGNSLVYRAFYALPPLTAADGRPTNAVYGFANMLLRLVAEVQPDYLVVAFDKSKTTFRHSEFAAYKATRAATPDDLRTQFPLVRQVLEAMQVSTSELEGYEADDIIGTLSRTGNAAGLEVVIVTGDRDALQLVAPRTAVLLTKRGITDTEKYDLNLLRDRYGLSPEQMIEVKGLMGDQSDNIPGVPGIGEKTAVKLIREYGSIDELLARLGELKGGKLAEKLQAYAPQALLSRRLATIVRDVPVGQDLAEFRFREPDYGALRELFADLGFRSLASRLPGGASLAPSLAPSLPSSPGAESTTGLEPAGGASTEPYTTIEVRDEPALTRLVACLQAAGWFTFQTAAGAGHLDGDIEAIAICASPAEIYLIPLQANLTGSEHLSAEAVLAALRPLLEDEQVGKGCGDGKKECLVLAQNGLTLRGLQFDPILAAYLLNPSRSSYRLDDLEREHLHTGYLAAGGDEICRRVWVTAQLRAPMQQLLAEHGMTGLYEELELPLVGVLAGMELAGVRVDPEQLKLMAVDLEGKIAAVTAEVYALAGGEFNLNSPKQLGEILFERLGLPAQKKTKTGYSTDVEVLEHLASRHPIADRILTFRHLAKLKSTYVDGLAAIIHPVTGRVHTTFNQTVTTTGRISSTEPNLQNIPIRTALGREIRRAFVPRDRDWLLLAADYSQIELRVLAHISGDETLSQSFFRGEDIHARTAAEVFGVALEAVTPEMRSRAKAVNFGIIYGISDYGLSQNLKISRETAKTYIDSYFARYPGVKAYMEGVVASARESGYVTTILNRRRYLPDLHSRNFNVRAFAERTAMNTPIQGSAADIIKLAMVQIGRRLPESGLHAAMILQVHDELIFEVPRAELAVVTELVRTGMEEAYRLNVPLKVDVGWGENWFDA